VTAVIFDMNEWYYISPYIIKKTVSTINGEFNQFTQRDLYI